MDNLKDDMDPRPNPPGSEDSVFLYVDAHFGGAGSMSTMTDPPPSQSPSEKHCVSFSLATNSAAWSMNYDNRRGGAGENGRKSRAPPRRNVADVIIVVAADGGRNRQIAASAAAAAVIIPQW